MVGWQALFYGEVFGRWCTWQCEHFKTFWVDVQLYLFMFRIQSVGVCWVWGVGVRLGMWFPAEGELGWSLFVLWQCLAHQPTMVVVSKLRSVRTNCLQRFRVCMKKRYTSDREREREWELKVGRSFNMGSGWRRTVSLLGFVMNGTTTTSSHTETTDPLIRYNVAVLGNINYIVLDFQFPMYKVPCCSAAGLEAISRAITILWCERDRIFIHKTVPCRTKLNYTRQIRVSAALNTLNLCVCVCVRMRTSWGIDSKFKFHYNLTQDKTVNW